MIKVPFDELYVGCPLIYVCFYNYSDDFGYDKHNFDGILHDVTIVWLLLKLGLKIARHIVKCTKQQRPGIIHA